MKPNWRGRPIASHAGSKVRPLDDERDAESDGKRPPPARYGGSCATKWRSKGETECVCVCEGERRRRAGHGGRKIRQKTKEGAETLGPTDAPPRLRIGAR